MAKAPKARLDTAGLTGLGLEKLVEILLDEASVNNALKSRLQAALAGGAGVDGVARLIDQRLDSYQKGRAYLSPTRANTLSVELHSLLRMITAELAGLDRYAGFERLLRFSIVGAVVEDRARTGGAKLAKLMEEARAALVEIALKLDDAEQLRSVPLLEATRAGDERGRCRAALLEILCCMRKPAADAWKSLLTARLVPAKDKAAPWRNAEPLAFLQRLATREADIDAFIELELLKAPERRDSLLVARMLHDAGRHREALEWVRKPPATMRLTQADKAVAHPGRPPRLLEADILDALKQKDEAQAIRWREFERTLQPDPLREYIAKLDDFAEFEEMDKALATIAASSRLAEALNFLVKWPRLDLASAHVLRHPGKWDGGQSAILVSAADALVDDHPEAATILYRVVVEDILKRAISVDYDMAATCFVMLDELDDRLGPDFTDESHEDYAARLRQKYRHRYEFWYSIPSEFY